VSLVALHRRLARGEERGLEQLLNVPLSGLALVYRGAVALRNAAYRHSLLRVARAPVWSLGVGGLSAGGSGKTPLAAHLASRIQEWGASPLLVARGYRAAQPLPGDSRQAALVSDGRDSILLDARTAGDEALLLAHLAPRVPVAIARRRVAALAVAQVAGLTPTLLVLDSAMQHRRLRCDFTITALDVSRRPGRERLLPWGDLREPWSALRRADYLALHRAELCSDRDGWQRFLERIAPGCPMVWTCNRLTEPHTLREDRELSWRELAGSRLGLWVGLGHPEALVANLAALGIHPVWQEFARDHAHVGAGTVAKLNAAAASERLEGILVTEKDAVKLVPWSDALAPILVCGARLALEAGSVAFELNLRARLRAAGLIDRAPGQS
jgi:tetraacyldisaccharide 4'-kinase